MIHTPSEKALEALEAIVQRAPERDPKWTGMTARDIALSALQSIDPQPEIVGDPLCKIVSYNQCHEEAVELGYPSLTEALEDLERLKAPPPVAGEEETARRLLDAALIKEGSPYRHSYDIGIIRASLRAIIAALRLREADNARPGV
jgi:hypothetical protein